MSDGGGINETEMREIEERSGETTENILATDGNYLFNEL